MTRFVARHGKGKTRADAVVRLHRKLRRAVLAHMRLLDLPSAQESRQTDPRTDSKEVIRQLHLPQRIAQRERASRLLNGRANGLLDHFADGPDVRPEYIEPFLEPIKGGTFESDLFRFATLTWSVPVSEGFGRRMRFLVRDRSNGKIAGVIGLGDPVFNLKARDGTIGWNADDRRHRLTNVMDAFVLGAVPPYSTLLGGKLVACLVRTKEVRDAFASKYYRRQGIIEGTKKHPRLVAVTTCSALGRSSVYNRLALGGTRYFEPTGYTSGYGHFHIPDALFEDMREFLRLSGHAYASNNRFGQGPNWKFRAIRAALQALGFDRDMLKHGIKREAYLCRLACNAERVLRGEQVRANYSGLLTVAEVAQLALERWVRPRAMRYPDFVKWRKEHLLSWQG